jgi:hypothetical protein
MKASLVIRERIVFSDRELVEMVVWRVPSPVPASAHVFKYRLVFIQDGKRVIGYDNERGKGDHRHFRETEMPIHFTSIAALISSFIAEVEELRGPS